MQPTNCPWSIYHNGHYPYDFPICEDNLCAWIRQPANSWSNLVTILIGLYLLFRGLRANSDSDMTLGFSAVIVGVCSFICHSTGIPLFAMLDVTAIFFFIVLLMMLQFLRTNPKGFKFAVSMFLGLFSVVVAVQVFVGQMQILFLMLFILFIMALELKTLGVMGSQIKYRDLFASIVILSLAAVFLGLDYTKTSCVSNQHFLQFHAIWHILSGASILFVANYMKQFNVKLFSR